MIRKVATILHDNAFGTSLIILIDLIRTIDSFTCAFRIHGYVEVVELNFRGIWVTFSHPVARPLEGGPVGAFANSKIVLRPFEILRRALASIEADFDRCLQTMSSVNGLSLKRNRSNAAAPYLSTFELDRRYRKLFNEIRYGAMCAFQGPLF